MTTAELQSISLDTTYMCIRTKTLVRTQFWVGKSSVAVRYLSQAERYLDKGKVIPLSTFARCYYELQEQGGR